MKTSIIAVVVSVAAAAGFGAVRESLFNGKDLSGWKVVVDPKVTGGYTASEPTWFVADGKIRTTGTPFGYLRTERDDFADYRLHVEYRWWRKTDKPNSGVFVRLAKEHGTFLPTCIENQLCQGLAGDVLGLGGFSLAGIEPRNAFDPTQALSGITKAFRRGEDVEKPFGEWNVLEVELRGETIVNCVNGVELNRLTGLAYSKGAIALQAEGGAAEFRNVWIERLTPADAFVSAKEANVKLSGHVAELQGAFIRERILSDYAKNEIWKEARDAFAHPDDDVFNNGIGMWKGEFWGKLMISACRVDEYLHDAALKDFLHEEALRLIAFQHEDGYLGTYVDKEYIQPKPIEVQQKLVGWPCPWNWNLWCRKYTLWGLMSAYRLTGDKKLLDAADKAMTQQIDMLKRRNLKLCDTGTSSMHGFPPCSILKPLLWLYQDTGKQKYLDYAKEIVGYFDDPTCQAVQFRAKLATGKPMEEWYSEENGRWGKAYEMMSCLAGFVEYYRVTGDKSVLAVASGMRDRILADELNLCYSVGYNDQFWGARLRLNGVSEPCDAIHWMRLNYDLYLVTGEVKYVDEIERCFYNAFMAAIRPDGKWGARCVRSHGRHQKAPPQSGMKLQHCCVNNMPRGFMDVARTILAKDSEGTLQVGLYHDSETELEGDKVTISGGYPIENEVKVVVERKTAGKVRFRMPEWCPAMTVCNGDLCRRTKKHGWLEVEAPAGTSEWHLAFDMAPRIVDSKRESVSGYEKSSKLYERWATNSDGDNGEKDLFGILRTTPAAQVFYGPLMLAKSVKLGEDEKTILDSETVNCGGWKVSAKPAKADGVWGAWTLEFEKDGKKKSVKACDYSSAALWGRTGVEFSVFF